MQFLFSWLPFRPIRSTFETFYPDKILSEFHYDDDSIRKTKMFSIFFFQYNIYWTKKKLVMLLGTCFPSNHIHFVTCAYTYADI